MNYFLGRIKRSERSQSLLRSISHQRLCKMSKRCEGNWAKNTNMCICGESLDWKEIGMRLFLFQKHNVPRFRLKGQLDSTTCSITEPFTGQVGKHFLLDSVLDWNLQPGGMNVPLVLFCDSLVPPGCCNWLQIEIVCFTVWLCVFFILALLPWLQVVVEHSEAQIKSIELQLVRVETCGCAEGYAKDGMPNSCMLFISHIWHEWKVTWILGMPSD